MAAASGAAGSVSPTSRRPSRPSESRRRSTGSRRPTLRQCDLSPIICGCGTRSCRRNRFSAMSTSTSTPRDRVRHRSIGSCNWNNQLAWMSELLTGRDGLVRELGQISPGGPRPKSIDEVEEVARQAGAIAAANDGQLAQNQLDALTRTVSAEVEKGPSPKGDALLAALGDADGDAIHEARRSWNSARTQRDSRACSISSTCRLRQKAPEFQKLLARLPNSRSGCSPARYRHGMGMAPRL